MKSVQGCTNRHIDKETLQQGFFRAVEILRENKGKLEKCANFMNGF
ncbi:LambdaSa04 family prophage resolvase [Streptococcus sanguinis SK115]|uniref:LambdaSa04 family prophage resolvase n=1 Tax=Streptococcus sanguinis SK115 TaxID=888810 RepID=F0I6G7_STRSA|nr:LambdaSa04 family prophage resolvase [Streptococcus sanguinis SK115]